MKNAYVLLTAAALVSMLGIPSLTARAHCEIPCGIYSDGMRIDMILEDCDTIEKSMTQITALSAEGEKNYNQIVRWVTNKDVHASKVQEVVTQYFMTQRIKPGDDEATLHKLALLHTMLVEAMKCKQTTDVDHVARLRELTAQFKAAYFGPEDAAHMAAEHAEHSH